MFGPAEALLSLLDNPGDILRTLNRSTGATRYQEQLLRSKIHHTDFHMRRDQIISASMELVTIIEDSQLVEALKFLKKNGVNNTDAQESAVRAFGRLAEKRTGLSPNARKLAARTELVDVMEPEFWTGLSVGTAHVTDVAEAKAKINQIMTTLQSLPDLLDVDIHGSEEEIMRIILTDKNHGRDVAEVEQIMESARKLYEACARTTEEDTEGTPTLQLRAADTGSEIVFILFGTALAIGLAKTAFIEVWRRTQLRHVHEVEQTMNTMTDGLSVIQKINEMYEQEEISEEEAKILKRDTRKSLRTMVNSGAITKEIEDSEPETRSLAEEEQNLLPTQEEDQQTNNDE